MKPIKISKPKYKIGNVVRYLLEQPKNFFNEKLKGNFRQGDVYFSNDKRKIKNIILMNTKPYNRCMLDGIDSNSFTDKQLLPVEDAVESAFNVKSIVNKKTINKKVYYLAQYSDGDRLWISQENLLKDNLKTSLMIMS